MISRQFLKLLNKFKAKGDVRSYLNYIYSNSVYLMASDGHKVARVKISEAQGYYDGRGKSVAVQSSYTWKGMLMPFEPNASNIIRGKVRPITTGEYVGLTYVFEDDKYPRCYMMGDDYNFLLSLGVTEVTPLFTGSKAGGYTPYAFYTQLGDVEIILTCMRGI